MQFTSVLVTPSEGLVNLVPVSMQFLLDDRRQREGLLIALVHRVANTDRGVAGVTDLTSAPVLTQTPRLTRFTLAAVTPGLTPPSASARARSVKSALLLRQGAATTRSGQSARTCAPVVPSEVDKGVLTLSKRARATVSVKGPPSRVARPPTGLWQRQRG